ncbi:MAG: hypothetical protein QOF89_4908 [Acidobacteriota bacterium]|nr:hypothetical protein [Acidobacteriota bacterium]
MRLLLDESLPRQIMQRRPFLLSLLALSMACTTAYRQTSKPFPWPGQKAPPFSRKAAFVRKGDDLCSHSVTVSNIEYNFDTSCDGNVVLYVQTFDKQFISPEGISIGWTLREAVMAGGILRTGKDCGVNLPSHWIARPPVRVNPQGTAVEPCSQLLDEEIVYFDTEPIEPHI